MLIESLARASSTKIALRSPQASQKYAFCISNTLYSQRITQKAGSIEVSSVLCQDHPCEVVGLSKQDSANPQLGDVKLRSEAIKLIANVYVDSISQLSNMPIFRRTHQFSHVQIMSNSVATLKIAQSMVLLTNLSPMPVMQVNHIMEAHLSQFLVKVLSIYHLLWSLR
ncbi:hypothetical protein EGR_11092 [Echinococcus granulosus]|uniref:Uncharacterized protein n=1 Tax=Echinococcus granulosus TaxID=6210 RepID=W6TZ25_ECHGR|nr:hypothetical protein EGR_11092 [Echinococcus granulosus]EUB54050.1 hypothetical protein EGR_11092 [Echinococcus granulosus]